MDEKTKLKNSVLSNLRAVLLSVKGACSLRRVAEDYCMLLGEDIPYRKLGFKSLAEFITTENAFRTYVSSNGEIMVDATPDSKSIHIVQMIEKQKTSKKSRNRNRRFAPVRNNVASTRVPSAQHDWKPKKLTPVKPKRVTRKKSINKAALPTNIAQERINKIMNDSKQEQSIKNSTPKPDKHLNESSVATHSNSNSYDEMNRKNTTEMNNKLITKRASRSNSTNEVDLLDAIPKELLRNVPCTDIKFEEVLDRIISYQVIKSPSSTTSNSTSTDSCSSIFSYSEVTDNNDQTSNPVSPMSERNFVKYSTLESFPGLNRSNSIQQSLTPRGRGRLIRLASLDTSIGQLSINSSGSSDDNLMRLDETDRISATHQFNSPISPASSNNLYTNNYKLPVNCSANERKLFDLLNELHLNYVPEIKVVNRKTKSGSTFYNANIKIGSEVQCSSWPQEFKDCDSAKEYVLEKVLETVRNKYHHMVSLPISLETKVGVRLIPLVKQHDTGIWSDTIHKMYMEKYEERLPNNWLILATKAGIRVDCAANEKFILTYSPGVNKDDFENSNITNGNSMNDLNTTISAPILPIDDDFLSVVITCTNSTVDVSFRIIGTPLSERYKRLTVEIEEYFSQNIPSVNPTQVKAGGYYAVFTNDTWMRVRVLEEPQVSFGTTKDVSHTEVLCSFIDHGHEYSIALHSLHQLPDHFKSIPAQAIHCSLVGLEELAECEYAMSYLEELVGQHLFVTILDHDLELGNYSVVLFDTTGNEDINVNLAIIDKVCTDVSTPHLRTDGTVQEMNVVHADSAGFIYLQEQSEIFEDLMDRMVQRLEESSITYITRADSIETDNIYLAKYIDNCYYRCTVVEQSIQNNSVKVLFIDFGNTMDIQFNVNKTHLLELDQYSHLLKKIPPQCVKAALYYNIVTLPNGIGDQLLSLIDSENGGILVKVIVPADKPGQLPVVELFKRSADNDTLYSINRKLSLLMREPKKKVENGNLISVKNKKDNLPMYDLSMFPSSSFPSTGDLPKPELPKEGHFFVNILSAVNPWNFFIQSYKDGKELNDWMFNLQNYYNKGAGSKLMPLSLDDIKPGECYVAQHIDQIWYRACVNQTISQDSISAFFVDFGQYVVLNSKQLQPLAKQFKTHPFQAIKAKLAGVKPKDDKWKIEDCRFFQELVVHKQFIAIINEVGHDVLHSSDLVVSVVLIDTSTNDDIYLDKVLIEKGIAVPN